MKKGNKRKGGIVGTFDLTSFGPFRMNFFCLYLPVLSFQIDRTLFFGARTHDKRRNIKWNGKVERRIENNHF